MRNELALEKQETLSFEDRAQQISDDSVEERSACALEVEGLRVALSEKMDSHSRNVETWIQRIAEAQRESEIRHADSIAQEKRDTEDALQSLEQHLARVIDEREEHWV